MAAKPMSIKGGAGKPRAKNQFGTNPNRMKGTGKPPRMSSNPAKGHTHR